MAKHGLAIMIGAPEHEEGGEEHDREEEDAAQDLIDAVKDGSAKDVHLAFARLYELCSEEHGGEEEEEEEEAPASGRRY